MTENKRGKALFFKLPIFLTFQTIMLSDWARTRRNNTKRGNSVDTNHCGSGDGISHLPIPSQQAQPIILRPDPHDSVLTYSDEFLFRDSVLNAAP